MASSDSSKPGVSRWLAEAKERRGLELGLSFQNLGVYGFDSGARYQSTVASYVLAVPRFLRWLVANKSDSKVTILDGIDGLVNSGEMLLVLGRPGSGCSTLLKTLAVDTHGISIKPISKVNYQGISHSAMSGTMKGECSYLAELDVHFPELTLGETLTFAAATRETTTHGSRYASARITAKNLASIFKLDRSFNTWVGNDMIRGLSGGEKRRTSIIEALMTGAQIQCWDNSTRGLDSATAQRFIDLLREYTDELKSTVIMTIYQASDSMYNKFDKVTVLYQGHQIYFGPVQLASQYFEQLGFARPPRSTTPDFLTSITNPAEREVRDGFQASAPSTASEFVSAWKASSLYQQSITDIEKFNLRHSQDSCHSALNTMPRQALKSAYKISINGQIYLCLRRALQRFCNQPAPVIGAIGANAILGLIIGSVYYNLDNSSDSMDQRAVLIFFSLLLTAFSPAFEVLTMWAQRPIVEKHQRYRLYHSFTDAVASMVFDLPNKIITAILFQLAIYFMTNLRRTPAAFFTWLIINFVLVLNMSMWFRLVGSVSRTMAQSTAPTCILVLLSCIYAGFVIPVKYMVGWLQWFRRGNPIAYAYESLMINEFRHRNFDCSAMVPSGPTYDASKLDGKICPVVGALAGESFVRGNSYLAQKYTYHEKDLWRNFGILIAMTCIICALHLVATEYIPAERSKGDTLQFYRRFSRKPPSPDVEKGIEKGTDVEKHDGPKVVQPVKQAETQSVDYIGPQNTLASQTSTFNWQSLCYEVKSHGETKQILKDINGWVQPGTLTALMGVTGSGKTTLLDVLADRAAVGIVTGNISVDNLPRGTSFQSKTGYAQQEDIHLPYTTVREALEFSALMRQRGNATANERKDYVNNVLDVLDMTSYADAIVGVSGNGLNVEQRKRLTIGVELAAKPELLLFLDEPTSGLDSQTAWSICRLLRKLANHGQAVLCTIHQPSAQLFSIFDRLLLLSSEGETVYFGDIGEHAETMISYLESKGAPKCTADSNPAEWMLSVTSPNSQEDLPDGQGHGAASRGSLWAEKWNASDEKQVVMRKLTHLRSLASSAARSEGHDGEYAVSLTKQLFTVTIRIFCEYWRSPVYVYSKLALCAGVALFNGLSFQNATLTIQGTRNLIFSIFLLTQMFGTVDQQVIPAFVNARVLFEAREGPSKTYSWLVFMAAIIFVEIVWQTIAAVFVFVCWYFPPGFWRNSTSGFAAANRGGLAFMCVWLFCLWISTFSQAIAAGIEHAESAVQLATLMFWFSLVFCGYVHAFSASYEASPLTYLVDGLVNAGLKDLPIACSNDEVLLINLPKASHYKNCDDYLAPFIAESGGSILNPEDQMNCQYCPISNTSSLLGSIGIGTESPWNNVGYLTCFIIFNILMAYFLYWVARVPKRKTR